MTIPWPPSTGEAKSTASEGLTAPLAPLAIWATPASNTGPRGFTDKVLELGPIGWVRWLAPLIRADATHIIIAYPGGQEGPADLRFDMVERAATHHDPRVAECGSYQVWADACMILTERTGKKVGFYLGTAQHMTRSSTLDTCENIVVHWGGIADFVCIDTLGDRKPGSNDVLAANRLASAGIEVWGEPRPTRGSVLFPFTYFCFLSKWESTGGNYGDPGHTPLDVIKAQGASVILFDETGRVHQSVIDFNRSQGIGFCVGVDYSNAGGAA